MQESPVLVAALDFMGSDHVISVTRTLPTAIQSGDIILCSGMRRETISLPSGYTALPTPEDPPSGDTFPQWAYMFWKEADGTEAGQDITVEGAASNRLSLNVSVWRSGNGRPLALTHIESIKQTRGAEDAVPLNTTSPAGVSVCVCATSWAYTSSVDGEDTTPVVTGGNLIADNSIYVPDQCRDAQVYAPSTGLGSISIDFDAQNVSNDSDSRSDIWIALREVMRVSGVIRDNTDTPCSRTVRLVERAGGEVVDETVSDTVTGEYLLSTLTVGSECQRIVLAEDSSDPLYNDLIDRVIPG